MNTHLTGDERPRIARGVLKLRDAAELNVRPLDVIFVKQHIVQLPPINHFSTSAAFVEVPFFQFA